MTPVACTDSVGAPYEITLELHRDGAPYGSVGERCGHTLARLARGVDEARQGTGAARRWADPDDRFPCDGPDSELFSFRYLTRAGWAAVSCAVSCARSRCGSRAPASGG